MKRGTVPAYLLVFSVQVVFTGYQLLAKVALTGHGIDPVAFAFVRAVGTTVLLFAGTSCCTSQTRLLPRWEDRTHFLLLGLCMVGNVLGLIAALKLTTSATVAFLQVMRPVFAGLVSWGMGIEHFTVLKVLSIGICIAGTLVIATGESQHAETATSPILGVVSVCIHSVGQSCYVLLQPPLLNGGYSATVINAWSFAIASILLVLLMPFSPSSGSWWQPSVLFFVITFWSIVLVGAYAYVAMGWAATRLGGTTVMLFMLLQAILTVLGGHLFLGEILFAVQLQGGLLVVLGLLIFVMDPKPAEIFAISAMMHRMSDQPKPAEHSRTAQDDEICEKDEA